jgi:hypothetical protein
MLHVNDLSVSRVTDDYVKGLVEINMRKNVREPSNDSNKTAKLSYTQENIVDSALTSFS